MGRRRTRQRTLHKADTKPAAPTAAATFTPSQALALVDAGRNAVVSGQTTALPRNPLLSQIPFGPGIPLVPAAVNPPRADSGRPEPRAYEYPITANLPGAGEKLVPWKILRDAADGVSMFRKCIEVRKNEVATLEWDIVISKKAIAREARRAGSSSRAEVQQAMQDRLEPEIARLLEFWEEPDRRNGLDWIAWAKKALEERFVLDALAVYPRHTNGGDIYSLEILDGSTIKPLLDAYGGRPLPPEAAYQQILWGFPRGEFIADLGEDGLPKDCYPADQLIYEVDNVRSFTPYGYSAVERALIDGALYMSRNNWMLAEFTDGVMPSGWLIAGEGQAEWSADELRAYEAALNDYYSGITGNRQRLRILPYGMQPHESANVAEKYKPDYDLHLIKLVAGHFDTTLAELGFTEQGGLGSTGWHEGQADVQNRKATAPTIAALQDLITKISRRHLGMPRELQFKIIGLETDDEKTDDDIGSAQYANGRKTLNDERDRLGLPRYTFDEANKPFIVTGTGLVFIEGALERQEQQQAQAQMLADAKASPPAGGDDEDGQRGGNGDGSTKPKPGGGQGKQLDKADDTGVDADLVKTEVAAYTRWARKNPEPRRPFQFEHAQPSDFTQPDPARMAFDDWVWEADLAKGDFNAWNAANPLHPKGPDGKFRKRTLGEIAAHLTEKHGPDRSKWPARHRRNVETMEAEHGGKAGHDNVERWDADPPAAEAARSRQERVDRARAFAEQLANLEEELADQHDTAEVVARVRSAADRSPQHEHLAEFASVIEGHQGDRAAMIRSARGWAAEHDLTAVGTPGERVTFDPAKHYAPPWMQREMRGDMAQPMQIVRPGYRFSDPEGGEEVRLSKPAIDFPEEPAPIKPSKPPRARKAALAEIVPTTPEEVEARRERQRVAREAHVAQTGRTPAQQEILADLEGRRSDAAFEREMAPKPASRDSSAELVRSALDGMGSREDAKAYLDQLGLKAPELKQLARDLNVPFGSKDSKAKVRDRIVQQMVGVRLTSHAIFPGPGATKAPTPVAPAPVHRPTAPEPTVHEPGTEVAPTPAQQRAAARAERLAARGRAPQKRFEDMTEDELRAASEARRSRQQSNAEAQRAANGGETDWELATRRQGAADIRSGEAEYRRVETALDTEQRTLTVKQREMADVEARIADAETSGEDSGARYERLIDARDALQQEIDDLDAKMAPMRDRLQALRRGDVRKADEPDPKAPAPDQRWPAWAVDTAIAAAYAAPILAAMAGGLTTLAAARALAERWLAASAATPGIGPATWLEAEGFDITPALTRVLYDLYTEAAYVGQRSAAAAIATPARLAVSLTVDWDNWEPGDPDAARLLMEPGGLQALLDRFGITIRTIAQHRHDELAGILAQGLEDGDGPDELAAKIRHLTGNRAQAYRIAVTETARAISAAAVDQYEQDEIPTKGWLNAADQDVCDLCKANEDAGDIPLDALFPSGEPFPPAHPHCRCAVIPGVEEL